MAQNKHVPDISVCIPCSDREKFKSVMEWNLYITDQLIAAGIPNDGALCWQNVSHGEIKKFEEDGSLFFVWRA